MNPRRAPLVLEPFNHKPLAAELTAAGQLPDPLHERPWLHWNIRGNQFFELHLKFEEIYNDLPLKVDALAERI